MYCGVQKCFAVCSPGLRQITGQSNSANGHSWIAGARLWPEFAPIFMGSQKLETASDRTVNRPTLDTGLRSMSKKARSTIPRLQTGLTRATLAANWQTGRYLVNCSGAMQFRRAASGGARSVRE
jgi:hypothetical protein